MTSVLKKDYPEFFYYIDEGKVAVHYSPRFREFSVKLSSSSAIQLIEYCPWSGKKFPKGLGDEFFERIDRLGLDLALDELDNDQVPKEMKDETWWISEGL